MDKQTGSNDGAPLRTVESLGVAAKHVERPTKESEAQQVLAGAFKEKLTVLPMGAATTPSAGTLPERVDILTRYDGDVGHQRIGHIQP